MHDGLPTEAQLDAALTRLASQYAEHAKLTGVPLHDLLARFLALAIEFRDRANLDALEDADWIPGLCVGWDHLLHGKRKALSKRTPPPRAVMTVADVAAILGWSKERARRWLKWNNVPVTRIGNRDLANRRDVVKAAKLRQRKRWNAVARRYQSR